MKKIMTISNPQMTRKITNTCSHKLFMFVFSFGAPKLVGLIFDVRVEKSLSFYVRAHVHLYVMLPEASYCKYQPHWASGCWAGQQRPRRWSASAAWRPGCGAGRADFSPFYPVDPIDFSSGFKSGEFEGLSVIIWMLLACKWAMVARAR